MTVAASDLVLWAVVALVFAAVNMRWLRLAADGPATPQARVWLRRPVNRRLAGLGLTLLLGAALLALVFDLRVGPITVLGLLVVLVWPWDSPLVGLERPLRPGRPALPTFAALIGFEAVAAGLTFAPERAAILTAFTFLFVDAAVAVTGGETARARLVVGVPGAPREPGAGDVRITEGGNADTRRGDG